MTVAKSACDTLLGRSVAAYLDLLQHFGEVDVYGELRLLKVELIKIVLNENAKLYSVVALQRIPVSMSLGGAEANGTELDS